MSYVRDWAFYFITDEDLTKQGIVRDAEDAVIGGTKVIQYRKKHGETLQMLEEAMELRKITWDADVDLIINDRLDIALAVGADGVHVGQSDMPVNIVRAHMPKGIIGVSVGSIAEAEKALADGATYLAVSPIWDTPTKDDAGPGVGPAFVSQVRKITDVHITTIGGIKEHNMNLVLEKGADSICAISATVGTKDVRASVERLETLVRKGRGR